MLATPTAAAAASVPVSPMRGRIRVGDVTPSHRPRVEGILRATSVFRDDEVDVALELFDEAYRAESGVRGVESGRGAQDTPHPTPDTQPDYTFVGAFAGDALIGYACYGPTPATDRTYDLYWIAVDPAAQGSGAGTVLLGEVERRLCDARGRLLVVETSSRAEYDATRRFYTARGYVEAARVGHFYAPGDDRVIYTKRLAEERRPSSSSGGDDGARFTVDGPARLAVHRPPPTVDSTLQ